MKKKRNVTVDLPQPLNSDDIAMMTDEELLRTLSEYDSQRASDCSEQYHWEIEICYLRRELQIRRKRREIEDEYKRELDDELRHQQQQEKYLPVADLDNSEFMFL